jgi:polyhydroxyalkanoate synthesis repressor PhaR
MIARRRDGDAADSPLRRRVRARAGERSRAPTAITDGRAMTAAPRIIKKYPNRQLYDVANDGHINLADVKELVLKNIAFQVLDAKSGEDLTHGVLLQIILEEESGATPMFSTAMLAQIVRIHGAAQQTLVGSYVEEAVNTFLGVQTKLQEQALPARGDNLALTPDLWKQFMQLQAPALQGMLGDFFEQSVKRFMAKQ